LILAGSNNIGLSEELEERIGQMITHLLWSARPHGSSPLLGDDDGGRLIVLGPREPNDFRDTVATAAALFGRGDWKRAADKAAVETLWLLGPGGLKRYDELLRAEPIVSSSIFDESGCSVMRDGWSKSSSYVLMDCGPHGSLSCGHSHADALSIEFSSLGKNWIIDPGTFTYTGNPELRDWFRSTAAHNTVTVDGKSQSITAGPFSWKHIANASVDVHVVGTGFDYLEASHDGYKKLADPVKHSRTIVFPKTGLAAGSRVPVNSYLIVRDSFVASREHEYAIRFHLAPECSAFAIDNQVTVTEPGGRRLYITGFGESPAQAQITRCWVSRAYGHRQPSLTVVFELTGKGPQRFTTFITPAWEGQSIAVERQPVCLAEADGFKVRSDQVFDIVLINNEGRPLSCGPLTADGRVAWARFEANLFSRGFLVHGHKFETNDGFAFRSAAPFDHCTFRDNDGRTECSLNGGDWFRLKTGEQLRRTAIDGIPFEVCHSPAPTAEDVWDKVQQPSEAIN